MNSWKQEIIRLIDQAFGNPGSLIELVVLLAISAIVLIFVMYKTGKAMKFTLSEPWRCVAVLITGALFAIIIISAVNIYISPHLSNPIIRKIIPICILALAVLAIATPLSCYLHRSEYFQSLFAIILSIAAAIAVILIIKAGFNAVSSGDKQLQKTKEHKENVNKFFWE